MRFLAWAAMLLALASFGVVAATPAETRRAVTPSETLDAFHKALRTHNAEGALAHLALEAVVYEQGFAETSRADWAKNQLPAAMDFAKDTERHVLRRESHQTGDLAWVISTTRTVGDFGARKLELEGTETAVLRKETEVWKIVHLHWSAHEKAADPAAK